MSHFMIRNNYLIASKDDLQRCSGKPLNGPNGAKSPAVAASPATM